MALLTTQKLTANPATTTHNDTPSGTFNVTRLTVTDTTPAIAGGQILIQQGGTSEVAIIVNVENGTQIKVEQLVGSYTAGAYVTFLGRTNPSNPKGTTVVRNASGFAVPGSLNKAEVQTNPIAKDIKTLMLNSRSNLQRSQTVLSGPSTGIFGVDGSLGVTVDATPTNILIAAAKGYGDYGRVDQIVRLSSDTTISSLTPGRSNYFYYDLDTSSWGVDKYAPLEATTVSIADLSMQWAWLCNEGSGTTITDSSGRSNFSITGTPSWSTGYVGIDGTNTCKFEETTASIASAIGGKNFSTYFWVQFDALGNSANERSFWGISPSGGGTGANYMWQIALDDSTNYPFIGISNGSTSSVATISQAVTTGVKYLFVITYERLTSGTSRIICRMTSDGTTWYEATNYTAILMQTQATYKLQSRPYASTNAYGTNCRYYRMEVFPDRILSRSEQQTIWSDGSEGALALVKQHWFDVPNMKMKYGNTIDGWTENTRVFVGEASVGRDRSCSLLHFDGSNGSTTMTDVGGNTWTVNGNAALSTSQFKFGSASLAMDGSGDSITCSQLAFNDGYALPWTAELWFRATSFVSSATIFGSNGITAVGLRHTGTTGGTLQLSLSSNNSTYNIASNQAGSKNSWSTGTWYHVALVFDGSAYKVYIDGVLDITVSSSTAVSAGFGIGLNATTGQSTAGLFNGFYDEWRFTYGVALYTANFTPSSTAFSNTGVAAAYSPVTYAYNAIYDTGVISTSTSSDNSIAHNIGSTYLGVQKFERSSDAYSYWSVDQPRIYVTTYWGNLVNVNRLNAVLDCTASSTIYSGTSNTHGDLAFANANNTSAQARLIISRTY